MVFILLGKILMATKLAIIVVRGRCIQTERHPFTSNSEMLCDFETGVSNEIRSFRYLRQVFVPVDKTKAGIVGLNYKIKNLCCPRRASVEASYYGAKRMVRRATTHFRDQVPLKVTSRAIILSLLWLRP